MSKQGLKRAGAKLPRGGGNVRFHDGNDLESAPRGEKSEPVQEKCDDGARVDTKKGFKYSIAKRIGLVASAFWGAVDVHNRLKAGKLTPKEISRKEALIHTLTEEHPLSQFEREFCVAHTVLEKPLPFAKDSEGGLLLEHIAQAGKKRVDIDVKNGKKNEEKASKADAITSQLLEKVGIDFKPVAAEMGVRAQQDSLRANCLKAIPDRFAATKQQLRAFEAVHYVPFEPPRLDDEAELDKLIRDAICHMDKSKSAGSDGFTHGHNEKGNFLAADILSIIDATKRRLRRLEIVGGDIGLFSGIELVQYGLRGVVFPAIKNEWHSEKKVFKMVKHPQWRAILMQGTIEYAVQFCLLRRRSTRRSRYLSMGVLTTPLARARWLAPQRAKKVWSG